MLHKVIPIYYSRVCFVLFILLATSLPHHPPLFLLLSSLMAIGPSRCHSRFCRPRRRRRLAQGDTILLFASLFVALLFSHHHSRPLAQVGVSLAQIQIQIGSRCRHPCRVLPLPFLTIQPLFLLSSSPLHRSRAHPLLGHSRPRYFFYFSRVCLFVVFPSCLLPFFQKPFFLSHHTLPPSFLLSSLSHRRPRRGLVFSSCSWLWVTSSLDSRHMHMSIAMRNLMHVLHLASQLQEGRGQLSPP